MKVDIERTESAVGKIVTITYDREAKLNSLTTEAIHELSGSFRSITEDPNTRAVILTGAGTKAFVGGADITELSHMNTDTARIFISSLHDLFVTIRNFPVPVIASINGYALGAGLELAASCDIRIASETAVFGMPEVRVGVPSVIEAALLPRLIGWGKSNYLLLTGENINAETAYDWGFLERLTKTNKLASESIEIAESIVASGPHAIRAQKELIRQWETLSLEDGIEAGISAFSNAYTTDEPTTMMQSFFDRKDR